MQPSTAGPAQRREGKYHAFNDQTASQSVVQVRQLLPATPARVFQAWLDPALAGRWLFATASRPMTHIVIDARTGGWFEFADDSGIRERGRYLDIQPERLLAFSRTRPGSQRGSKVVVEFSQRGPGCLLRLTHSEIPADQAGYAEARWEGMLYGLKLLLGSDKRWIAEDGKSPRATSSRRPPLTRG